MNVPQKAARISPLRARWAALAPRERQLVAAAAALVLLALVIMLAVRPAVQTLRSAPAQIEALDTQLQQMQRLAVEAAELRATPPVDTAAATAALQAASARLGAGARLSLQGERAVLTLSGVGTEQLRGWLSEVRSGARARPVEASLSRGAGGYSGTIVVALGGAS